MDRAETKRSVRSSGGHNGGVVRRLPVIQSKAPEDAEAQARPPWHWVLIGAGIAFTSWIPLAMLALWAGRKLAASVADLSRPEALSGGERVAAGAAILLPLLVSFVVACAGAGALVGRFGGRAGRREAALAGAVAALAAWLIALASGALAPWPVAAASGLVLLCAGAAAGWLGGRVGAGSAAEGSGKIRSRSKK